MTETENLHVRWMIRRDMQEVIEIERSEYGPEWKEEDFLKCLRTNNCIGMVVEADDKVVGFMIYEMHKNRLEVLKMGAVNDAARKRMVQKLKTKLSAHRRRYINFLVPLKNFRLLNLLKSENFKSTACLNDFYKEIDDDAVKMRFSLQIDDV